MLTQEIANMVKSPTKGPKAPKKAAPKEATKAPRRLAYNRKPAGLADDSDVDEVKAEFANRLADAMARKGWNQSMLARRATEKMKGGGKVERSVISHYIRAHVLPTPPRLHAVAAALGVEPFDLLPTRGLPSLGRDLPPFEIKSIENDEGAAWLRINRRVPMSVALQIAALLNNLSDKA